MYKVIVNVSGKRARIVPDKQPLLTAERDFGEITQEQALANRDTLVEAVKGLLQDKGVEDSELYSIEVPDSLTPPTDAERRVAEEEEAAQDKGPVTKPKNPKKGEVGEDGDNPDASDKGTGKQPSETEAKAPAVEETKKD